MNFAKDYIGFGKSKAAKNVVELNSESKKERHSS